MLSIILTANNERHLASCIKSIEKHTSVPHKIVVVLDDTDGQTSLKSVPRSVVVLKNEERMGVGRSRNRGAYEVPEGVYSFCDAHIWVKEGSFDVLYQDAMEKDAIIVPAFGNFRRGQKTPLRYNYGSGLTFLPNKAWFYLYVQRYDRTRFARRGGCHAVGMTMNRRVFERLGGWVEMPGFWSSNDVAMSLKARLTRTPILLEPSVRVDHMMRSVKDHQTPRIHQVINRYFTAGVLFSEETYQDFWVPLLDEKWKLENYRKIPGWGDFIDESLDPVRMKVERERFRSNGDCFDEDILGKIKPGFKIAV